MINIAIFASGSGSNFENIAQHVSDGRLQGIKITALYTDQKDAFCIDRAHKLNIPVHIIDPKAFKDKQTYETHLLDLLKQENVQWIVLAGYMRLIGNVLLSAYPRKILNIHPSLLPKFKGIDAIGQAYHSEEDITGSTVHYVDSGMDTGEIIEQMECAIHPSETKAQLEQKVKRLEYELYPKVINKIIK